MEAATTRQSPCFSALQRAENSSMREIAAMLQPHFSFSALQRAENSSIRARYEPDRSFIKFQCSSASRKFLNLGGRDRSPFRAGFQCSSASRKFLNLPHLTQLVASAAEFQCSSASRKFLNYRRARVRRRDNRVSVLFSEPKIPQLRNAASARPSRTLFQCSSASRKFLNRKRWRIRSFRCSFQCSSASRKFLNPKRVLRARGGATEFQCSSASRKFLNSRRWRATR